MTKGMTCHKVPLRFSLRARGYTQMRTRFRDRHGRPVEGWIKNGHIEYVPDVKMIYVAEFADETVPSSTSAD